MLVALGLFFSHSVSAACFTENCTKTQTTVSEGEPIPSGACSTNQYWAQCGGCPSGVDACSTAELGDYKCINNNFVSRCDVYSSTCDGGYWHAVAWPGDALFVQVCTNGVTPTPSGGVVPTSPPGSGGDGCNASLGYNNCDNLCSYNPPVEGVCECCKVTTNECIYRVDPADGVCKSGWYTPGTEWFCGTSVGSTKSYTCEAGWFTDSNCSDNTGSSSCGSKVTCNEDQPWCGGSKPSATPTKPKNSPTPTTPVVTETPSGPQCNNISMTDLQGVDLPSNADAGFVPGETSVKFRCGADKPALVDHYEFRVTAPSGAETTLTASSGTLSDDAYLIEESGLYTAQCRICISPNECHPYEGDGFIDTPPDQAF
jgi:hypothetical protein